MKLTVDVCLRAPLARSLSVVCLSAWHRATPSLLYIQLLGAAHDKRYCIFISASRGELSRIRGFLTARHEHTLTFLITYPVCIRPTCVRVRACAYIRRVRTRAPERRIRTRKCMKCTRTHTLSLGTRTCKSRARQWCNFNTRGSYQPL